MQDTSESRSEKTRGNNTDLFFFETQENFNNSKSNIITLETLNFSRNPFFRNEDSSPNQNRKKSTTSNEHKGQRLLKRFVRNNFLKGKKTTIKYIQNNGISNDLSNRTTENNVSCNFSLDENSLAEARKILLDAKTGYLFYVNLDGDGVDNGIFQHLSNQEQDDLLHWQYVFKEEKYLLQLPVDFDLITYSLLSKDNEEFVINLILLNNASNCKENFIDSQHYIRNLLRRELFLNASNFSLCNRYFGDSAEQEWLYFVTSIWVGYDLTCSEVSIVDGRNHINGQKEEKHILGSVLCYLLSFQFVWIFTVLDIHKKSHSSSTIKTCYEIDDRPYGLKRLVLKLLYIQWPCSIEYENPEKTRHPVNPVKRLLLLTYIFILFPFGAYRTIGRYCLNTQIFKNYSDVIRPSDFIGLLFKYDILICIFDFVYATILPVSIIWLGEKLYNTFMTEHFWTEEFECCRTDKPVKKIMNGTPEEITPLLQENRDNEGSSTQDEEHDLTYGPRYHESSNRNQDAPKPSVINGDEETSVKSAYQPSETSLQNETSKLTAPILQQIHNDLCSSTQGDSIKVNLICDKFVEPCHNLLSFATCACIRYRSCCKSLYTLYKGRNSTFYNNRISEKRTLKSNCTFFFRRGYYGFQKILLVSVSIVCCLFPSVPFGCNPNYICKSLSCFLKGTFYSILLYFFCLRPILSTFTFILRSFTYFVFVALIIRAHIMQYTLIFVAYFVYILKYLMEITKMNAEILRYIFNLKEIKAINETDSQSDETCFVDVKKNRRENV